MIRYRTRRKGTLEWLRCDWLDYADRLAHMEHRLAYDLVALSCYRDPIYCPNGDRRP